MRNRILGQGIFHFMIYFQSFFFKNLPTAVKAFLLQEQEKSPGDKDANYKIKIHQCCKVYQKLLDRTPAVAQASSNLLSSNSIFFYKHGNSGLSSRVETPLSHARSKYTISNFMNYNTKKKIFIMITAFRNVNNNSTNQLFSVNIQ